MAPRTEKLIIGPRLRVLRLSLGLTQAQMAAELGVSPSYITLIESDQRPASARFLMKLAEVYDLNVSELAPAADAQLVSEFETVLKDPTFGLGGLSKTESEAVLQASPRLVASIIRLHDRYRERFLHPGADAPLTDLDKVEIRAEASLPIESVRNWIYAHRNYFDALDRAAEALSEELDLPGNEAYLALANRLDTHGIHLRTLPAEVMGDRLGRFDPHRQELVLSELLSQSSRRFQVGVLLGKLEQDQAISHLVDEARLDDPAASSLMRISLANYFAAALLMPYGRFLDACESTRYDIELLSHRFGSSFEQIAHRMTTLQREGAHGIPFFFVRVDRAGNITKRFSAGRFPFSRFGGTCPLWNIHAAFETPEQIRTQIIRMPEGASYFSIARTVTRSGGTHGQPAQRLAIGLGCDVAYAPRLVYADGMDLERSRPVDIGLNCYLCERSDCAARAHVPINRRLKVSERERSLAIFQFEPE